MKLIGLTKGGTVLMELNLAQARTLCDMAGELGQLDKALAAEGAVVEEFIREHRTGPDNSGKQRTISAKTTKAAGKLTGPRKCIVCGGPVRGDPRKKLCSQKCALKRSREQSLEYWHAKYPKAAKRIPAPAVTIRTTPVSREDRLNLIRQADERVRKLREEEQG